MRVETNERLARRNRQIAQYLFFATFGILIFGLFFINSQVTTENVAVVTIGQTLILPLAFITTLISVRMTNLWVRQPRPEAAIREALKGISNKSVLYNYYHFPARHVLISPQGVFAMVTRWQDGKYTVDGKRWSSHKSPLSRVFSLLRFDGIGDPSSDAIRAAAHVKKLLAPIAPDVEVHPVVVFVDSKAEITTINPTVPVVNVSSKRSLTFKDLLRDMGKANVTTLTPEQIEAFDEATLKR